MENKIEYLRQKLYLTIDAGNTDKILKASIELDAEIVKIMLLYYMPNKNKIQLKHK